MAIYKKGADPVALRSAAERITAHARECDTVRGEASRAVGALKGQWGGGDLDHLMNRWPPIEAQLTQFGTDLGKLAEALRRNAGQQDTTSGQGGGLGGGFGGPPVGGPGGSGGSGGDGIPGYDLLKDIWTPIKGFGTATLVAGMGFRAANFLQGTKFWNDQLSLLKNLGAAWKHPGPLGALGEALDPRLWSRLPQVTSLLDEGSAVSRTLGTVGKALGPIGVGFGAFTTVNDIVEGNYDRAAYDGVMTSLGAAALLTPPPISIGLGIAAGGMAVGQLVYDNWDTITDFTGDAVDWAGDVAGDVGDFAGDVAGDVGDFAGDVGSGIADVAEDVWPF